MKKKTFQIVAGTLILTLWGLAGAYGIPSVRLETLTNYPNPFDARKMPTIIAYQLESEADVSVQLYDLFGLSVRAWRFFPGESGAVTGENKIRWDGRNDRGDFVAAGGYICQVVADTNGMRVQGIRKIAVIH
jgi:hypothetical protein